MQCWEGHVVIVEWGATICATLLCSYTFSEGSPNQTGNAIVVWAASRRLFMTFAPSIGAPIPSFLFLRHTLQIR